MDLRTGFTTAQVHAGAFVDSDFHSRVTPVYETAGYVFDDLEDGRRRFSFEDPRPTYGRISNPTNAVAEARLAVLENAAGCKLTSSGQAAITAALLTLARSGEAIVATDSLYSGTFEIFRTVIERAGVQVRCINAEASDSAWEQVLAGPVRAVFTESIPNPNNDLVDIRRLADIAHRHHLPLVVDNTVATPYLFQPVAHGADIVVHSTSKWLAGHAKVIGGAVIVGHDTDYLRALTEYVNNSGCGFPPHSASLLLLGIETLSLRMDRAVANAQTLAEWLQSQPEVRDVRYAGLASSPWHERAVASFPRGTGAVVSFDLGGLEQARAFYDHLQLISRMTHIGDVRTLAIHCASTLHVHLTAAQRAAAHIPDGLIRLSVGIEDAEDLTADLAQALSHITKD